MRIATLVVVAAGLLLFAASAQAGPTFDGFIGLTWDQSRSTATVISPGLAQAREGETLLLQVTFELEAGYDVNYLSTSVEFDADLQGRARPPGSNGVRAHR